MNNERVYYEKNLSRLSFNFKLENLKNDKFISPRM